MCPDAYYTNRTVIDRVFKALPTFLTALFASPPANIDNDLPNIDGAPLMPLTT